MCSDGLFATRPWPLALAALAVTAMPPWAMAQTETSSEPPRRILGVDLLPLFGTSAGTGGEEVRRLSLNIVGGVSAGLEGIELGGVLNVKLRFAHGLQMVGGANLVMGPVAGGQIAGGANIVRGDPVELEPGEDWMFGVQTAGGVNVIFAGDVAAAGEEHHLLRGVQVAGGGNIVLGPGETFGGGHSVGVMVGGLGNILTGRLRGVQATGGVNVAHGDLSGAQLGSFNYARQLRGLQLGAVNIVTGDVLGMQLGLVNVAARSTASLGLVNVIWDGRLHVDTSMADTGSLYVGIKNGGDYFHSIYQLGFRPGEIGPSIAMGLGLGARAPLGPSAYLDLDGLVEQLHHGSVDLFHSRRWRFSAELLLGLRAGHQLSVFAGAAYRFWLVPYLMDEEYGVTLPEEIAVVGGVGADSLRLYHGPGFVMGIEFL